jgi:ABC-type lipoprotein export system ATPase subunit
VSSGTPDPIVRVEHVSKSFDRGVIEALEDVSLEVAEGEHVAITGPSGCGKSTLMHLLAALDRPDEGSITVAGHDLTHLDHPNRYRREVVGLVFQLHNLLPHLSAVQNVEVAMFGSHHPRREVRERASELLDAVGLGGKAERRPPRLSGGERQRVAIARALANDPTVLLADEPTGSLDQDAKARVLDLLERLRREAGLTVVTVTHDMSVAERADRIVRLSDGHVEPR